MTPRAAFILYPMMLLVMAFFIAHVIVTERLGGSAANGKVEDGRYYVGSHGKYVEVSRESYYLSLIQSYGLFVIACLCVGLGFVLWRKGEVAYWGKFLEKPSRERNEGTSTDVADFTDSKDK